MTCSKRLFVTLSTHTRAADVCAFLMGTGGGEVGGGSSPREIIGLFAVEDRLKKPGCPTTRTTNVC